MVDNAVGTDDCWYCAHKGIQYCPAPRSARLFLVSSGSPPASPATVSPPRMPPSIVASKNLYRDRTRSDALCDNIMQHTRLYGRITIGDRPNFSRISSGAGLQFSS